MKHTQSFLSDVLDRGRTWVKNAGDFVERHPYLMGGAIGGAMLVSHFGNRSGPGRAPPLGDTTPKIRNVLTNLRKR